MEEFLNELENLEIPELTNSWWVAVDENNRIWKASPTQELDEQFLFDFSLDFDVSKHHDYKIVDGELVYDEFVYPEIEPQPTEEQQRITVLEEQLAVAEETQAATDEAVTLLYEMGMTQDEVNNAQDEAIIGIYEMFGGV